MNPKLIVKRDAQFDASHERIPTQEAYFSGLN